VHEVRIRERFWGWAGLSAGRVASDPRMGMGFLLMRGRIFACSCYESLHCALVLVLEGEHPKKLPWTPRAVTVDPGVTQKARPECSSPLHVRNNAGSIAVRSNLGLIKRP